MMALKLPALSQCRRLIGTPRTMLFVPIVFLLAVFLSLPAPNIDKHGSKVASRALQSFPYANSTKKAAGK
jgi:hypothetical protein